MDLSTPDFGLLEHDTAGPHDAQLDFSSSIGYTFFAVQPPFFDTNATISPKLLHNTYSSPSRFLVNQEVSHGSPVNGTLEPSCQSPNLNTNLASPPPPSPPAHGQMPSPPTLHAHNAARSRSARRISRVEWESHRGVIEAQHPNLTLPQLQEYMQTNHNFFASTQQWKKKFAEWNLNKNLPSRVTKFIQKRSIRRLVDQNKGTQFTLNGKSIPMDKVKRHLNSLTVRPSSPTGSTPDGLSYNTYNSPRSLKHPSGRVEGSPSPTASVAPQMNPPAEGERSQIPEYSMEYVAEPENSAVDPIIAPAWEGKDMDDLLSIADDAQRLSKAGKYFQAKPLFMECIEGLEFLLGAVNPRTVKTLEMFAQAAASNQDLSEAIRLSKKSYEDHKDKLGSDHIRAWQSFARLGKLYHKQGFHGQAYHTLSTARNGLLSAIGQDDEQAYNQTNKITSELIDIATDQRNLEEAGSELAELIGMAEGLGDAYLREVLDLKHKLVHLYSDQGWSDSNMDTVVLRNRVENVLLEIIRTPPPEVFCFEAAYICSWNQLCEFYTSTGQLTKLRNLLPRLEEFVATVQKQPAPVFLKLLDAKQGIAGGFTLLQEFDKAEWWLLHCQEEIDRSAVDIPHTVRLSTLIDTSQFYFKQEKVDEAKQWLRKAQAVAQQYLPPSHQLHSYVANAIAKGTLCPDCLADPKGKKALVLDKGEGETSQADQSHHTDNMVIDVDDESDSSAESLGEGGIE